MEKYKNIDEYVATEMGDKIVRKNKSSLPGLLILAVSLALLEMLRTVKMGDTLMTMCLTIGIIGLCVGLVVTGMCMTGAVSRYVYLPTGSAMRRSKRYLSNSDYQLLFEAIRMNKISVLYAINPVTTSNSAVDLLYSKDHAIALLQAMRDNGGHFEPEAQVEVLTGSDVNAVEKLCK